MIKRGYVMSVLDTHQESGQVADRVTAGAAVSSEFRPAINYILGSLFNDQYQSKCQQRRLWRASTVKARVNAIHAEGRH